MYIFMRTSFRGKAMWLRTYTYESRKHVYNTRPFACYACTYIHGRMQTPSYIKSLAIYMQINNCKHPQKLQKNLCTLKIISTRMVPYKNLDIKT